MAEPVLVVAVALLAAGVVATLVPMVPGGLLSLAGLVVYWWGVGNIPWPIMAALVVLVVLVVAFDAVASLVAARVGGASWRTAAAGTAVGLALLFVLGPVGLFAGIAGTVFLAELRRGRSLEESLRTASYATVGIVATEGVKFVVNLLVLIVVIVLGVL